MSESLQARVRAVIDEELANQAYVQRDKQGHVDLVDGSVDTNEIALAVVEKLGVDLVRGALKRL